MVLTSRCNCACRYCFYSQQGSRRVPDRFTPENIEAVVAAMPDVGITDLVVSGGEPLLRMDLVRACLRAARRVGLAIWLSTNGLLIDADIAAELAGEGLRAAHLSLDQLGSDPYRGYSKRQAETVVEAARHLKNAGIETVGLMCVIGRHNRDTIGALLEFAIAQDLELVFQPMFVQDDLAGVERLSPHEWRELAPILRRWGADGYFAPYLELWLGYYEHGQQPSHCHMGENTIVIDSDGQVFVCFHRHDLAAGNVLEHDLGKIVKTVSALHTQVSDAHCFGEHCISLFT